MRSYMSNTSSQDMKVNNSGVRMQFMFDQYQGLNKIKHLIPDSVLVSTSDTIPGLADLWSDDKFYENKMLKLEQASEMMMNTLPTFKLYLTQVHISFRESVEKELVRQVQQFLEVSKSVSNKVIFKEKKLICGFHNGWEFVNRGGSSNRVTLKQGQRSVMRDEEGYDTQIINLEYSGMHEIDNVFDSDSSVIVLQLEYDIEYVAQARQIATRVIGWIPVSISGKLTGQKEISITEVMLHGPGKAVDGQRMMSLPYRGEFDIKVMASFRTVLPGANQMNLYEEIQRAKQIQQDQVDQQYSQNMSKQQQMNMQYDVKMQEMKKQQMMNQQGQYGQIQGQQGQYGQQGQQGQYGQQGQTGGGDIQMQMLDQQIMNERRRLMEINEQIHQKRQTAFTGGSAQYNPATDYQMITWEPRNEQERLLKNLQIQSQVMKDQIQQLQRERDQAQLGLTQEYRLMREELVKSRVSQQATSSGQGFFKRSLKSSPSRKNNYDDNDEIEIEDGVEIIEGRELDFNPVKSKVTYSGKKDKPLIVHLNQPSYGSRELSKKDKLELINSKVPGLLDDIPIMNTKEQTLDEKQILEQDMKDPLKASHIIFRILSFKPNAYQGLPKRMYLTLNFFDFPKYQTESFSYEGKDDRSLMMEMIEKQSLILLFREAFLKGEEDKFLSFKFEIDPSKSRYNDLFRDFVSYLLKKTLHIDIWDADTLMLFGSFKVPLNQIRRSGLNRKATQLDLEIVNPNFIGSRGSIQVQIDNIGKEEQNPNKRKLKEEQENEQLNSTVNTWQNKPTQKAKIISEKSISIPQNYIKNLKTNAMTGVGHGDSKINNAIKTDEQQRKIERIKRYKNAALNQAALLFEDPEDNKRLQKLNMNLDLDKIKDLSKHRIDQIEEIKNRKKPDFVKSVISKFLNEEKVLSVSYGKQEIVPYLLHNTTNSKHTFNIFIEDGDSEILPISEFETISDETEWRYWCQALGHPEPSSYDILAGNTIILEPQEKATILFKFMTYRNIDPQLKDKVDAERIASQKDDSYRQKHINPRAINVFFSMKQQTIVGGFKLRVEPHQQVIDHIFRYYEKQNKSISITLPPLYLKNDTPQLKPTLHVTNNSVQLDWVNDQEIALFTKMPQVSKIMKFNILIYNSDFRSNLLSNIQIELHSLEGVDVHVNMGQSTQFKLNIPGDIPRVIQLYSSQPDILWFLPPYEASFQLPPGKITQADASIKSLKTGSQRIHINAVDIHSNQLVHSWIVRIETDIPNPTKVIELTAAACKESIQIFEYFNKSGKTKNFSFLSSDPTILEMLDPSKQIMGKSGEEIGVRIVARDYETPESQVIVFVSDYEESIFDTLKFRIRYIFNEEAQSIQAFNKLKKQKDLLLQQQAQQSINQSILVEQQQQQQQYTSGTNFYDQNATSQSFYQDQAYQQQSNNNFYNNKQQPNNNNQFYDNNYGENNNNYRGNQNNNNNYNNNNNQYDNYQNSQYGRQQQNKRGNPNYEQENNYQDYGNRNQQQRNYDGYDGYSQQNYDNSYQQGRGNINQKKVSFGEYDQRNYQQQQQYQQQNYNNNGRRDQRYN